MDISEEQVRAWVRSERAQILAEEQEMCEHSMQGALHLDGTITCIQCNKLLTQADEDNSLGAPAFRGYLP